MTKKRLYHGTTFEMFARIEREGRVRGMFTTLKTRQGYGALYWARVRSHENKLTPVILRLLVPMSVIKKKTSRFYYVPKIGRMIRASYINGVWVWEGGKRGWRFYKSVNDAVNRRKGKAVPTLVLS